VRATQAVGRYGERVAVDRLERAGMQVLDRNWRCEEGELDIVALDGGCVVAVEVKTRRSLACGHPFDAVTPVKARRLRGLAARWLREHEQPCVGLRVDVVAVIRPPSGPAVVEHLRGVA